MLINQFHPEKCGGGVPAHFISTIDDYAEKCLKQTPDYDVDNYRVNFKDEVMKMLNTK